METPLVKRTAAALVWALALQSSLVRAQESASPSSPLATVVIFGKGQTRQVQNLSRADLISALPGTSPLKTLQKLPGVSFQSADAFGMYEWSTRLSVRGFNQGQLGFTLDGIPLGNMSYGNNNGLHISRAITTENIRRVDLSQGAGSVGTASTSNLGGTVQFFSDDPQEQPGLSASQTVGSHQMRRAFARVDSGLLGGDIKLYLSAVDQQAQKWKGQGPQSLRQFNGKVVRRFARGQLSGFYNHSDRAETDYQDFSLDMRARLGWDWDNYAPDWERALLAASGQFSGAVNSLDDAYFNARGLRKDELAGLRLQLDSADAAWNFKTSMYHHRNRGQGHWYTPYASSSPTIPIAIRTTEYGVIRHGVIADLAWNAGKHVVNGGFWYERNTHDLARRFYAVAGPADTNYFLTNPASTGFAQQFQVRTAQFYLQDTLLLLDDKLKINAGFKHPNVTIEASSINAARAAGTLQAKKSFLPQLGLNYELGRDDELFASVSHNLRAFEAGVYGQFSQSQAAFDANGARLRPETSVSADLGLRFKRAQYSGSVALYNADFHDRLLSVATCAGIVGCPNTIVNVGRVQTRGIESALHWTLAPPWTWFNALTLNRSRYRTDYLDNGKTVPASGKQVVDAPSLLAHTELGFDRQRWFAKLSGKYTGQRYYTFTNDGRVPGYAIWDLSGGMRHGSLTIQVHVSNLFNKRYFSTIGSNQFTTSDPHGTFQTLQVGAPREVFLTINGKL